MIFRQLFDPATSTYTYLLADADSREAVIIDPVREQKERDLGLIHDLGLRLVYALDTHVHADHVTGLGSLREATGCKTVLSERAGVGCADVLVRDGSRLRFGKHELEVLETPGHTDGCLTFVTGDEKMAFTGDALLIRGTGRTDFQQGDPEALYRSITDKIFSLPGSTLVYPGHDYNGRTLSTVEEEKRLNPRIGGGRSLGEFREIMENLGLPKPRFIDVALPANMACGTTDGLPSTPPAPINDWAPVERSATGIVEVAPAWVARHAGEARLIDVRDAEEFRGPLGHVPGSELIPLAQLEAASARWERDAPLVLTCRSGGRSGKAAQFLESKGFTRVASMRGGMLAWNDLRYPTSASA